MSRSALVIALSLLFAGAPNFVSAAGEATAKPPAKRSAASRVAGSANEDVLGRTVFQTLIGEFALRNGEFPLAADAWSDLAMRTRDPKVFERAVEVLVVTKYYERALELLDLWQKSAPDSIKARQMRSTLLVLANRTDDLAPQIAQMLAQDKAHLGANLLQLNRLMARQTDKKAVFRLVERLTLPYRDLPEAHFALAQAAMAAGDERRAAEAVSQAVNLRPDWEMAVMLRAQLALRQEGAGAAIGLLEQFVGKKPEANDARLMLARLLVSERRISESRTHFEYLVKEAPNNPDIVYPLAMLVLQQGDIAFGRSLLERVLETDFADKGTVHYFLGQLAEEAGKPDEALAHYQQVTNGDQYIASRARSAVLLQKAGQVDAARTLLRETRGGTANERTQLVLAESQLLRETGRVADAYAVLQEALKAQPDNLEFIYEAGMLAEREGRFEVMEAHFRHLLSLKPDHAHTLNALGYSYADRNIRLEEAERLVQQALAATPDDPFITDSLGWVYFRQGRLVEALATLQRAFKAKADPEIAAHIGEVLWAMGRHEEARRLLLDAQKQHPGHDVLGGVIKKLMP